MLTGEGEGEYLLPPQLNAFLSTHFAGVDVSPADLTATTRFGDQLYGAGVVERITEGAGFVLGGGHGRWQVE